jgi:membrane protein required for colicin V production
MFQSVTAWDWFVWAVVMASVGLGWFRGFLTTTFALTAWLVALLSVPLLAPWAVHYAPVSMPVGMVCVVVFAVVVAGIGVVSRLASQALAGFSLKGFDRLVGALLGAVRAFILVAVVAMPAHSAGLSLGEAWQTSHVRGVLDTLVDWAGPFVPSREDLLSAE